MTFVIYICITLNNRTMGGLAGHMAHPIDYVDFTAADLKKMITDMFLGRISNITEKIDGTNIQATMNECGEVVFLRNNKDLNSELGGMTIKDMAERWAGIPSVANTFITAGQIITKAFKNINARFFNPTPGKKLVVNCECVMAGVTNVMPYEDTQVDFHDIHIYIKKDDKWVLEEVTKEGLAMIELSCKLQNLNAKITPQVFIRNKSASLIEAYHNAIDEVFGGSQDLSINDWKYIRFRKYASKQHHWMLNNEEAFRILFNRWFNSDKSTNIKVIRQMYPNNVDELSELDKKEYKDILVDVIEPLDRVFINLGNDVIRSCDGFINGASNDKIIQHLLSEIHKVIELVKSDNNETLTKLTRQLYRLEAANGVINSSEGIVFRYNGRLMKLTGSFAPLNQILGTIKFSR